MLAKATKLAELMLWAKTLCAAECHWETADWFLLKHDLDVIQSRIYVHYVVVKA